MVQLFLKTLKASRCKKVRISLCRSTGLGLLELMFPFSTRWIGDLTHRADQVAGLDTGAWLGGAKASEVWRLCLSDTGWDVTHQRHVLFGNINSRRCELFLSHSFPPQESRLIFPDWWSHSAVSDCGCWCDPSDTVCRVRRLHDPPVLLLPQQTFRHLIQSKIILVNTDRK